MKTPSRIPIVTFLLSSLFTLARAEEANILSVRQSGEEVMVEAQAPAGFKKLTLEGRGEDGLWHPRSVRRTGGAGGSVTFEVPIADHFEWLRVRAEREEKLAAKFFKGASSFHEYSAPAAETISNPATLTLVNNSGGGTIIFNSRVGDEFNFPRGPYSIDDIFPMEEYLVEVSRSGGTNGNGVVRVALGSNPQVETTKLELKNGAIRAAALKDSKLYLFQSQYEAEVWIDSSRDLAVTLSIVDLANLPNLTVAGEVRTNLSLRNLAYDIQAIWPSENTLVFASTTRFGPRIIRRRTWDSNDPSSRVHNRSLFNLYEVEQPVLLLPAIKTFFFNSPFQPAVLYPIFYPSISIISPLASTPELIAFDVADPAEPKFASKLSLDEMASSGASEFHATNDLVYLSHTLTEMEVTGSNSMVRAVFNYQMITNIAPATNITTVPQRVVSTNEVIRMEIQTTITGVDLITNIIEKSAITRFVHSETDSLAAPIRAVAAGSRHGVSLDAAGRIDVWGNNTFDQLGSSIFPALPAMASIAAGDSHTLARDSAGQVWGWGANHSAQVIAAASTFPVPFPVFSQPTPIVVPGLPKAAAVAAGFMHSLALAENGEVWSWGDNRHGQLGVGDKLRRNGAVVVVGLSNIVTIAAGSAHNAALDAEGRVYVWGQNGKGQLGMDETTVSTPTPLSSPVAIIAVAAGNNHTLLLTADGDVFASGHNQRGALGSGSTESRSRFEQVLGLPVITTIAAGRDHSVAVDADGGVWAWGRNDFGQADAVTGEDILSPRKVQVLPPVNTVSAGGAFTLALTDTGELWGWGDNASGQQGSGSEFMYTNQFQLTTVQSVTNFVYHTNSFVDLVVKTNLVYVRQTNVFLRTNIFSHHYFTYETNWFSTYRQVNKSFANVIDYSDSSVPVARRPVSIPGRLVGLSHEGAILYTIAAHSGTNGEFQGQWLEAVSYDGTAAYHLDSKRLEGSNTPMVEVTKGRVVVLDEAGTNLRVFQLSDAPSLDSVGSIPVSPSHEMELIGSRIVLKGLDSSIFLYDAETLSKEGSATIPPAVYFPLKSLAAGPAGFWVTRGWQEPIHLLLQEE